MTMTMTMNIHMNIVINDGVVSWRERGMRIQVRKKTGGIVGRSRASSGSSRVGSIQRECSCSFVGCVSVD